MKKMTCTLVLMLGMNVTMTAQQVNDNNTPLHLMKPDYRVGYGVSKAEDVKAVMDRVLNYIEAETPAQLINRKTGEQARKL